MLDKDAFEAFRESGDLFNRQIAARLRRLLESGGMKDGMTLYRAFRGADPDKTAMLVGRGLMEPPKVEEERPRPTVPADSLTLEMEAKPLAPDAKRFAPNVKLQKDKAGQKRLAPVEPEQLVVK